ncbi:MucB/RseB C-terminal domain-containing protein [Chromatiaceae bacterium AAb-1]|nr:MucB/RseB C-terminal domain-containing protein [Chromatiaceae bacterium AAb-1]
MRLTGFCGAIALLVLSGFVRAEQAGWTLFERVQYAVSHYNFDVSFVVIKGNQTDTYRWLHGQLQDTEIEHLVPLDTSGVDILRRDNHIYYLLTDRPAFVTDGTSIKELPALLFENKQRIAELYDAVVGSNSTMSGRNAQLLRLTALQAGRYSYWLWIDAESGFPLRIDTISEQQNPLERWLVTHMQITPELPSNLQALAEAELPAAVPVTLSEQASANDAYQLSWLPSGYRVIPEPVDLRQQQPALLGYWLLTDGLHQVSVFVQKSQSMPAQAYRDGATTIYVQSNEQLEVTVIGPVSIETARQLAMAVR